MGIIAVLALSLNAYAKEGGGAGNGGASWVCKGKNGNVVWSQLVDLFEAESEFDLTLEDYDFLSHEEGLEKLKRRIKSIDGNLFRHLSPYLQRVESNFKFVPSESSLTEEGREKKGSELERILDAKIRIHPSSESCPDGTVEYVQIANYTHYGAILINEPAYKEAKFAERDRIGIKIHEAVYAFLREFAADTDSTRARQIVGIFFSTLDPVVAKRMIGAILQTETQDILTLDDLARVNAGKFSMGSDLGSTCGTLLAENAVDVILTEDFLIQRTEVTQWQWFQVMESNPSYFRNPSDCPGTYRKIHGVSMCPYHPVESIAWEEVQEFIKRLNLLMGRYVYRLPTEAEWEFAARAGTTGAFNREGEISPQVINYNGERATCYYANSSGKKWMHTKSGENRRRTTAVASLKNENAWGLFDMHGNVWEWVRDVYGAELPGGVDPKILSNGNQVSHVLRGGSYRSEAKDVQSSSRSSSGRLGNKSRDQGFRLVRMLSVDDISSSTVREVRSNKSQQGNIFSQRTITAEELQIQHARSQKYGYDVKYYEMVFPNQEEIQAIEREKKVRVHAYFTGGGTWISGLPMTETDPSYLDLGLEMGGGFYLDFNKKVGLFADVTGGIIGKYIFFVGPLSVSSSAGVMVNTSKTSGIYLGGNFYRQIGYNRLAEQSMNGAFLSIETGYKNFKGNEDKGLDPYTIFLRYGNNVEQPKRKLFSVGFRINLYTGKK